MLTLGAYLHDLNPVILPIHGSLAIRWYGLAYVAGFAFALVCFFWMSRRGVLRLSREGCWDFVVAIMVGTVVGGRLGYALIYSPDLLTDFSSSPPFWGLLNITRGGMASHGGMAGLALACLWTARKQRVPPLHLGDALCMVAPFGVFCGRVANFINGELLGRVVAGPGEPAPWWAVRYPHELVDRPDELKLTPEQDEALRNLLSAHVPPNWNGGAGGDLWEAAARRLIAAVQHGDVAAKHAIEPLLNARHPSQLYEAAIEGLLVGAVCWAVAARRHRVGCVVAAFFMTYGVGRIAVEFIRLPDTGLAHQHILGLSRGQWLSVLMVVIGAGLLAWNSRRKGAQITPGWLDRPASAPTAP